MQLFWELLAITVALVPYQRHLSIYIYYLEIFADPSGRAV